MIVPVKWRQVTPNFRVVLPTGRVVTCIWVNPEARTALLCDETGDRRALTVDPDAEVPMVVAELELALASLSQRFGVVELVRSL
jgi:hypothetical protein